jgi:hypothetical protein
MIQEKNEASKHSAFPTFGCSSQGSIGSHAPHGGMLPYLLYQLPYHRLPNKRIKVGPTNFSCSGSLRQPD